MPQEQLNDNQVQVAMRDLVRKGSLRWTDHAEQRMVERGYDRSQIRQCLLSGYFFEQPYIPNRNGDIEYKFTVRGQVDGEVMDVVAVLMPETRVLVITVI